VGINLSKCLCTKMRKIFFSQYICRLLLLKSSMNKASVTVIFLRSLCTSWSFNRDILKLSQIHVLRTVWVPRRSNWELAEVEGLFFHCYWLRFLVRVSVFCHFDKSECRELCMSCQQFKKKRIWPQETMDTVALFRSNLVTFASLPAACQSNELKMFFW
jgi:hypothetical protein